MKISIIVPIYNVEKYIERCIQSILNQTLQDFEIIVVNDFSPDNSMNIVKKYAELDSRIKIFENSQNLGSMWTRKVGVEQASGNYFMFCDSDDYLPENALEILYNNIVDSDADIVVGSHQRVYSKKCVIYKEKLSNGTDSISVYKSLMKGELNHTLWGKIFRRSLFDNYEYEFFPHQTNGEDGILFYQIVKNTKKIKVIDDVVYIYCINQNSSTQTKFDEERYKQIIFARSYTTLLLKNVSGLSNDMIDKTYITRLIYMSLEYGYIKPLVIQYATIENVESYFSWEVLSRYYSGLCLIYIYSLLNIKFINSLCHSTKKIIKKLMKIFKL